MSKFCGNCGAQMDDSAMVCGYCGTPFNNAAGGGFVYKDPEKEAKIRKTIKIASISVASIIVLVISISIISSFVGYRGAVRKFMNAYKAENADEMIEMSCSFMRDMDFVDYLAEKYQSDIEDDFDDFDDHFASKYSIKYEITSASKVSERQARNILEDYVGDDEYDDVKSIMIVKVRITAKHGSDSTSTTKDICLGKESGKWGLIAFE